MVRAGTNRAPYVGRSLESLGGVVAGGQVFVSYAHADSQYVQRLVAWLRGQGLDVWFDEQIPNSLRWDQVLERRIDSCSAVVAIMSPAARESYWVGAELDHARRRHRPIFPLLLEGEPVFGMGVIQYESVRGGRLPSAAFVAQVRDPAELGDGDRSPASGVRVVRQVGVVPNAADCFQQRPVAQALDRALTEHGSAIVTQILSGLGGVGKTQLAASLVRQLLARGAVDDVVWVTATTEDAVISTLGEAGVVFADAAADDPVPAARRFLAWASTTPRRWLVVFDDVSDPNDLNQWWPPISASGRVLVTTRRRDDALLRHGQLVEVEQFTADEARAYLAAKFLDHPHRLVQAEELTADLGYLPVALAQAAAYIADRDLTCAQYRQRFAAHPYAALAPSAWPDSYARSVAVTLSLAVEAADRLDPVGLARPLLTVLSVLDPNGIPLQVITSDAVVTYLQVTADTSVEGDQSRDALTCLTRLNLADLNSGGLDTDTRDEGRPGRVRVHALVQRAARDQTAPQQLSMAAGVAADALVAVWPEVERDTGLVQLLRANTIALRANAEDQLWAPDCHDLMFRAGRSLGEAGQVGAALEEFGRLATEASKRLGPDHADTLTARHNVARWRGQSGDPPGAADAFEELLHDQLRLLGPDHPDTIATRGNLARWRGLAGDPASAVAAFEELLPDCLRILGPDHPDTLTTRHNLARWRGHAGDAAGAVRESKQLLADRMRVLGPDHPDTLASRHDIARWTGSAGDPIGALAASKELLPDRVRVLGPDHPDTLITRSNIANWQREAGDPSGAAQVAEDLLADRLRVLGPHHPDTLTSRHDHARCIGEAGNASAALEAFQRLLPDRIRVLGPHHPDTLNTRAQLAWWLGEAGDPTAAASAFQALLDDRVRVLGAHHPDTLTTHHNLAHWTAIAASAEKVNDAPVVTPKSGEGRHCSWWPWRRRQ
jgi:TIR domain-containing protein/NB-ARC domain-containing protein/tetratricopeptide repeat protein